MLDLGFYPRQARHDLLMGSSVSSVDGVLLQAVGDDALSTEHTEKTLKPASSGLQKAGALNPPASQEEDMILTFS